MNWGTLFAWYVSDSLKIIDSVICLWITLYRVHSIMLNCHENNVKTMQTWMGFISKLLENGSISLMCNLRMSSKKIMQEECSMRRHLIHLNVYYLIMIWSWIFFFNMFYYYTDKCNTQSSTLKRTLSAFFFPYPHV